MAKFQTFELSEVRLHAPRSSYDSWEGFVAGLQVVDRERQLAEALVAKATAIVIHADEEPRGVAVRIGGRYSDFRVEDPKVAAYILGWHDDGTLSRKVRHYVYVSARTVIVGTDEAGIIAKFGPQELPAWHPQQRRKGLLQTPMKGKE